MADKNVRFIKVALQSTYDALVQKDSRALYWVEETQRLYCGSTLYGTGAEASTAAAGLLSAKDYALLQELIEAGPASKPLTPAASTVVIADGKIGVGVSEAEGNLIKVTDDGIFAAVDKVEIAQVAGLEDRLTDIENAAEGGIHYRGSVPTKDALPADAMQGDLYECVDTGVEYCWNGKEWFEYGSAHFVPVAGSGIAVDGSTISVKIADEAHGLVDVDGGLSIKLATDTSDGAMSKEDKKFIDSIPGVYSTIDRVKETTVQKKYNISNTPEGTIVNYGEDEIRIMCPADAKFVKQQVGDGGNANMYYMTFTTYAPEGAVTFKEGDRGVLVDEILDFENTAGTGVDKYGRKFKNHWFALASYDAASDKWTYFGKNSSADKYIGWDYCVKWFDKNGVVIGADRIRINLSNEDCHDVTVPYYMSKYATTESLSELQEVITWIEF